MLRARLGRKERGKEGSSSHERGQALSSQPFSFSDHMLDMQKIPVSLETGSFPHVLQRVGQVLPSSNPHGEENNLQRSCPGAGSLIAAASLICIPLRKGKRKGKSPSCPSQRRSLLAPCKPCRCLRAEEIASITDTGLSISNLPLKTRVADTAPPHSDKLGALEGRVPSLCSSFFTFQQTQHQVRLKTRGSESSWKIPSMAAALHFLLPALPRVTAPGHSQSTPGWCWGDAPCARAVQSLSLGTGQQEGTAGSRRGKHRDIPEQTARLEGQQSPNPSSERGCVGV